MRGGNTRTTESGREGRGGDLHLGMMVIFVLLVVVVVVTARSVWCSGGE